MTKWLIIGASSFTGRHFCEYLQERGESVHRASLSSFRHDDMDYVVNFAAANVVAPSWMYPELYLETNVVKLATLLTWLKGQPIKRYVHISTPEVYGSTKGWVKEDADFNPSTPYATSRAAAELLCRVYAKQYGLPVVVTRSCNVYGPGQQLYRFIPKLIATIKRGLKFPLEGDGASWRSFLYVTDVCDAIYRVAMYGQNGEAHHISHDYPTSIKYLARMVCKRMDADPSLVLYPAPDRPGKDEFYQLDSNKIRSLGWGQQVSLEEGIDRTIAWMEQNWDKLQHESMEFKI